MPPARGLMQSVYSLFGGKQDRAVTLREHKVTLHGATVRLRPMTENDWDVLARWGGDPDVLWSSEGDDVQSYSLEDVQGIYRETSQTAFCFVIEVHGYAIGECWLQKMNLDRVLSKYPGTDCRRIDLTIGEKSQWGRGYGTDTIRTLTRWAFEDQGADMVFGCEVADYNPRSRRAFERAGYLEDQRVQEPAGAQARWSYDLALRRDDYFRKDMPNKTAGSDG